MVVVATVGAFTIRNNPFVWEDVLSASRLPDGKAQHTALMVGSSWPLMEANLRRHFN